MLEEERVRSRRLEDERRIGAAREIGFWVKIRVVRRDNGRVEVWVGAVQG
jgi:hypothetical protein